MPRNISDEMTILVYATGVGLAVVLLPLAAVVITYRWLHRKAAHKIWR